LETCERGLDTACPQAAWAEITAGRAALANLRRENKPGVAPHTHQRVGPLLSLLWHADSRVRKAAALALAGGDQETAYSPPYGHYAGALLRGIERRARQEPESAAARYKVVADTLRHLLDQNASEIRYMGNMRYSFLGSALYVALLSTCRDTMAAIRRLRVANAHPELCRLLWNLTHTNTTRRLNAQDAVALAQMAGETLAVLPPDEIPEFWRALKQPSLPRRMAIAPAIGYLRDPRAVPHLVEALNDQPVCIAQPIIECLGRMGDLRAIASLRRVSRSQNRQLRNHARAAISAIERANADSPARTLLRPVRGREADPASLLRPVRSLVHEPPEELLRPPETRQERERPA